MKNIEWRREHRLPLTKKLNYSAPTQYEMVAAHDCPQGHPLFFCPLFLGLDLPTDPEVIPVGWATPPEFVASDRRKSGLKWWR